MDFDTPSFIVQPQTPKRHMRHRASLEHILSFTLTSPPPAPHDVEEATLLYHLILHDCEAANVILRKPSADSDLEHFDMSELDALAEPQCEEGEWEAAEAPNDGGVPLHKLFRAIYDYCPRAEGRANVVRIALHGLFPVDDPSDPEERALRRILPRARCWRSFSPEQKERVYRTLAVFASEFLEGFFVPLKAQGRCTPVASSLITPTSRTEVGPDQGTPTRLSDLRSLCLARDGNRCVITGRYDTMYLEKLFANTNRRPRVSGIKTEAAHIIPHSLNALSTDSTELHPSKRLVWRIMNMFDPGISATLCGSLIDTPANAMMLAADLHDRFGRLQCYLEAQPSRGPDTYTFHTTRGAVPLPPSLTPAVSHIVFRNHERTGTPADLPSPRLLALHRACCLMLAMSGAAEYVESLLRDTENLMERGTLASDGSSNIALFLRMRGVEGADVEDGGWGESQPEVVMAR